MDAVAVAVVVVAAVVFVVGAIAAGVVIVVLWAWRFVVLRPSPPWRLPPASLLRLMLLLMR